MDNNQDKPKTLKAYLHPLSVSISEAIKADGEVLYIVKERQTENSYELNDKIYEFIANSPMMENLKLIVNNLVQKTQPDENEVIKAYNMLVNLESKYGKVKPIEDATPNQ